jgi:succinoglycan biosynthesis transport protein ExoP
MTEDQGFKLGDLRSVVRRRLPVMAALAGAVLLLSIVVASLLPNLYIASATLLVEPQSISKKLIESGVAESDLNNRLHLMTMQILSRPRLSKIIDDLKLYPDESDEMTREEVIELMRDHIRVEPVLPELETPELRRNREIEINTFRLSFTSGSAPTAAAVANRLANDFSDEHIKARVQISGDTSEFIDAEVQKLQGRIRDLEAQTAQIKADNPGRLPDDMLSNQRLLENAIDNLRQAQRQLAEAQSDEAFYRQQSLQAQALLPTNDDADPKRRIEMLELKMGEYRSRGFTDKHPDVVSTQQEIDQLKARLESEGASRTSPRSVPQLQAEAEMRRAGAKVQGAQQDIERLSKQVDELQNRIAATPRVAEQLVSLTREYDALSKNLEAYGNKRLEAGTAANMERRQKGEQFRVLDSAVPPPEPASPRRLVIVLVGLMLGLALGGGVGLLLESGDTSFHTARDLQQKLRIPVLAEIPAILLDADRAAARRRRFRTALAAGAVTLFVLLFSGGGYFFVNVLPGLRGKDQGIPAPAAGRPISPAPAPAAPAQPASGGAAPATGG